MYNIIMNTQNGSNGMGTMSCIISLIASVVMAYYGYLEYKVTSICGGLISILCLLCCCYMIMPHEQFDQSYVANMVGGRQPYNLNSKQFPKISKTAGGCGKACQKGGSINSPGETPGDSAPAGDTPPSYTTTTPMGMVQQVLGKLSMAACVWENSCNPSACANIVQPSCPTNDGGAISTDAGY
jgi:hypothetical protein